MLVVASLLTFSTRRQVNVHQNKTVEEIRVPSDCSQRTVEGRVRQRTIATLDRLDVLRDNSVLDKLTSSLAKHTLHTAALSAHEHGDIPAGEIQHFGPVIVFEGLWRELRIPQILTALLNNRRFEFALERVLFVTVLH